MVETTLSKPKILVAQYIPMGKNHMLSLNRHIGAHKSYISPTEFGLKGEIKDIAISKFKMKERGVLLTVDEADMHSYSKLQLSTYENPEQKFSLKLDQDGLSYLGADYFKSTMELDDVKVTIGKMSYNVAKYVYPILTDAQQEQLSILYGCDCVETLIACPFTTPSYSLVISEKINGVTKFTNAEDFVKKNGKVIDAITDWILWKETIDNIHIFIGMRAAVAIGKLTEPIRHSLDKILFLESMFNASFRMFSKIWTTSKAIKRINNQVSNARYNQLKEIEKEMIVLGKELTLLKVLDKTLDESLESKRKEWEKLQKTKHKTPKSLFVFIDKLFQDEIEKAYDRDLMIDIISSDISALQGLISQRVDLILTRNSEILNIIALVFTLLSLFGISGVRYFAMEQWVYIIPLLGIFLIVIILYLNHSIRNFLGRRKTRRK